MELCHNLTKKPLNISNDVQYCFFLAAYTAHLTSGSTKLLFSRGLVATISTIEIIHYNQLFTHSHTVIHAHTRTKKVTRIDV